jgi:hypothetical protein
MANAKALNRRQRIRREYERFFVDRELMDKFVRRARKKYPKAEIEITSKGRNDDGVIRPAWLVEMRW